MCYKMTTSHFVAHTTSCGDGLCFGTTKCGQDNKCSRCPGIFYHPSGDRCELSGGDQSGCFPPNSRGNYSPCRLDVHRLFRPITMPLAGLNAGDPAFQRSHTCSCQYEVWLHHSTARRARGLLKPCGRKRRLEPPSDAFALHVPEWLLREPHQHSASS